jgi:hypothetical protein
MARITAYPAISAIAGGDLLVVSDVGTVGNPTKTVTVDALSAYAGSTQTLGYKTYAVELSNFGLGAVAPTPTIMQNNLGTIVWSYISLGKYRGTLAVGDFTTDKTFILTQTQVVSNPSIGLNGVDGVTDTNELPSQVRASINPGKYVELEHFVLAQSGAATKSDNMKIFLEIRVYD